MTKSIEVPVRGGALTLGEFGDPNGTVIFGIHGITSSHRAFAALAHALPNHRILAPDLRGRGRSASLPGPWRVETHVTDCVAALDALEIDSAIVVGHSMGALVSVVLAAKNPKRIYDSAKLMGEHLCVYYNGNMGVDTVVLRFATTYGPGKTARHGKMGVTSQIVEAPASGKPFHIAQGGDEQDDFVYNKDSALGIYLATIARDPKSRIYNIGSGTGSTLRDFERALRKHIPNADIQIGPGLNFLGMPYPAHGVYDTSRAREELGFRPEYDIEAGVADYLESLRSMKARAA